LVYDKRRDHLRRRGLLEHDDIFRGGRGKKKRPKSKRSAGSTQQTIMKDAKRVVKMGEGITVGELAQAMMVKSTEVIQKLMALGEMATVNQAIDFDTASMVAEEFNWRVESVAFDVTDYVEEVIADESDLVARPPVVTVMGHVDHGKTSLLDCIRNTRVTDGEAGGITQHIGAYRVNLPDKGTVVFIDTPGHEAFTAMRARGAKATDIVILVVAADDGVMPQTIEAINHAQAAEVPIIVAVNKIDKQNANTEKVLSGLSEHGLVSEEWGGQDVFCQVSALKNEGIDHLLEMVLLQAEVMELKANATVPARGLILEGRLEKGRGPVATILVQEGTLRVGDTIVSNTVSGRIRALHDDQGNKVDEAGPSMPVEVLGLSGVPEASEDFLKVKDDKAASKIVDHRVAANRIAAQAKNRPVVSLDNLHEMLEAGEVLDLKIIVKADVHGSAEALTESLEKLSHPEVNVNVIHKAVGGITESDINLAAASDAIVSGFGVRPESKAKKLAEREKVDVKLYTIIYEALEEVRAAMAGMLAPVEQENALGVAEVRELFTIPKVGTVAGCSVTEGMITRNARVRVVRDSVQIYDGDIGSLRRFKDQVKEVKQGYECGIGVANFNDIKVGDLLEVYEIEQIAATLD
jgi:translation initiation factor IF-2